MFIIGSTGISLKYRRDDNDWCRIPEKPLNEMLLHYEGIWIRKFQRYWKDNEMNDWARREREGEKLDIIKVHNSGCWATRGHVRLKSFPV